ncbi:late competence development ComFB family protein [Roseofilum reptotaenium CS-1145]|uniref:Competence protein ComFB n=1 Tax=Roseofilum reptotaenium AO1-A TaxID=1925591 RepID=A0A1L9QKE9_9CYAN|nr:late competence development ComFB family protein [Roseofilum reptotaenium]MDB9516884.1 late competence development ComFB family protein [Roseofilum reptotaenium CS-1145]OJJ16517.1 hypothetical protein BI308_23640 [Roseofilum reptotaenium AO1-A]
MEKYTKPTLANAMVALVHEEFLQQFQQYPATTLQQINLSDAIAYALNQLPPLYTTKEEDWESYKNDARQQISFSIKRAVETGIKVSQIHRKGNR